MTDTNVLANSATDNQETTHFGFETVRKDEKVHKVAQVFHSVAAKYDIMNDLMSGGIHRLWKRFTIDLFRRTSGTTHSRFGRRYWRFNREILTYCGRERPCDFGRYQ